MTVDPLDYSPTILDLEEAANARGEDGPLANPMTAHRVVKEQANEIDRLRKAHEDVREQIHETRYAGLLYRTNAEGMCSEILRIIHEVLGSNSVHLETADD